jgi:hypothetical protein
MSDHCTDRVFPAIIRLGGDYVNISVNSYSGSKFNERPEQFVLDGYVYRVQEILDRWHSPDSSYFKVIADDGNLYILRYHNLTDEWTLESYRRVAGGL